MNTTAAIVHLACLADELQDPLQQDALQEVCLRLLKHDRFRFSIDEPTRYWRHALVNARRDQLRSECRFRKLKECYKHHLKVPRSDDPFESASKKEATQVLRRAVRDLPIKYRQVIELHFFEQTPCVELARRWKVSPETIRTRCRRGIEKLKQKASVRSLEDYFVNIEFDCAAFESPIDRTCPDCR